MTIYHIIIIRYIHIRIYIYKYRASFIHFGFSIGSNNARHYAGFERTVSDDILNHIVDHDGEDGIPDNADDPNERELLFTVDEAGTQATYSNADFTTTNANCARIGASTCRQNYARHKYI